MNTEKPDNPDSNQPGEKPDWEKSLLEQLAFASLTEQRKTRRWGIFFKFFFAGYLLLILIVSIPGKGIGDKPVAGDYTALVEMDGVIAPNTTARADYVVHGLRQAFKSKAKGVILRTNSPGGSPVQSGYINDEIVRLREKHPKKPFYAVITDVCASGCYYAVANADKIYANQASIVGSIGVLMDSFGFVDAIDKLGVERRLLTAGKNKAMLDPFSPVKPGHRKHVQSMLNEIHQQFIDVVKEGRGSLIKDDNKIFSGLFWTGDKAVALGLVDELGSASFVAREVIGAEQIVDYTYRENWLDRFAAGLGTAMANTLSSKWFSGAPKLN